jgi:hypothetical protein
MRPDSPIHCASRIFCPLLLIKRGSSTGDLKSCQHLDFAYFGRQDDTFHQRQAFLIVPSVYMSPLMALVIKKHCENVHLTNVAARGRIKQELLHGPAVSL